MELMYCYVPDQVGKPDAVDPYQDPETFDARVRGSQVFMYHHYLLRTLPYDSMSNHILPSAIKCGHNFSFVKPSCVLVLMLFFTMHYYAVQ